MLILGLNVRHRLKYDGCNELAEDNDQFARDLIVKFARFPEAEFFFCQMSFCPACRFRQRKWLCFDLM